MYDPTFSSGDTQSIWYSKLSSIDSAALVGDGAFIDARLEVDVAIIGAGITGLSVAYHLCKAGRSVAVFDKGLIGSGETGRTTAHLANALDEHYTTLEQLQDELEAAQRAGLRVTLVEDAHLPLPPARRLRFEDQAQPLLLRRVPASRLPRAVECCREILGLPVSGLALRSLRASADRTGPARPRARRQTQTGRSLDGTKTVATSQP